MKRIFFGLFILMFALSGCGGGGGNSGNNTSTDSSSDSVSSPLALSVVLGPIVHADVSVSLLNDLDLVLLSGKTQDGADLLEAGWVLWDQDEIPPGYENEPLYISVSGGYDIDANDDGIRDSEPKNINFPIEFIVPSQDMLSSMNVVANPLLKYASRYVMANLEKGYSVNSDDVGMVLQRVARVLISDDIDEDGKIGWSDIVKFDPRLDINKSVVPWNIVLFDIEKHNSGNSDRLVLGYNYEYIINKSDLTIENNDLWDRSYGIKYETTHQIVGDLISGIRGGWTELPDGSEPLSYRCAYWNETENLGYEEMKEFFVEGDTSPPLFSQTINGVKFIGGAITSPESAPMGMYGLNYHTADGEFHSVYHPVFHNDSEINFTIKPNLDIDNEGYINSLSWSFFNQNGDEITDLEALPIVSSDVFYLQFFETYDKVNLNTKRTVPYVPTTSADVAFSQKLNYINPGETVYPLNNGHKILLEDLSGIVAGVTSGDGTIRAFGFSIQ